MCGPVLLATVLLLAGCAGSPDRPPPTGVTRIPQDGGWFCQPAPSGEGWECIQDAELAADPEPSRLPEAATPPEPAPVPLPVPEQDLLPGQPSLPQLARDEPAPSAGPEAPAREDPLPPSPPAPEPPDEGDESNAQRPAYARLAYQPPEPVALMDLPGDFYAVQVLATSTRKELEAFTDRHGIREASAARVERDGELYFVLLLGIYETEVLARRAMTLLPETFDRQTLWVRSLASLQEAMARADAMAGAMET